MNFCPVCGVRVETRSQIRQRDEYAEFYERLNEEPLPAGFTFEIGDDYDKNIYLGYGVSTEPSCASRIPFPSDVEAIKATILELVKPIAEFVTLTDADFGLWVTNIGH